MSTIEVERRREIVARDKLMGFTIREIALRLFEVHGIFRVNETGEQTSYSESTVKKDLVVLKARWREAALEDTTSLRGEQLATIRSIRRAAMLGEDLGLALRSVEMEMKLTGTAEAIKLRHEFGYEAELEALGVSAGDEFEKLVQDIERIVVAGATRDDGAGA